jgi:hypothetical protein
MPKRVLKYDPCRESNVGAKLTKASFNGGETRD